MKFQTAAFAWEMAFTGCSVMLPSMCDSSVNAVVNVTNNSPVSKSNGLKIIRTTGELITVELVIGKCNESYCVRPLLRPVRLGNGISQEGYRVIGFDIEDMSAVLGIPRPDGCELRIRDVRSIHGSELKDAAVIVGSSPCQEFSYRAMPWKRAKALPPPYLGMELFNAQFRIQREAIEAAGHYIPLIVENVRGAQKWVGRAQWNYGSFYLWGDVPALMPLTFKAQKVAGFRFDNSGK